MKGKEASRAGGTSFDNWLDQQDETFKTEVIAGAMKRQFVMKLRAMMKAQSIGVNALQKILGTGPSQIQRWLDPEDIGISLKSIARLLAVFGAERGRLLWNKSSRRNEWLELWNLEDGANLNANDTLCNIGLGVER